MDRGDYTLVVDPNLGAQAAGRGLGRFTDLFGPPALNLLRKVVLYIEIAMSWSDSQQG